MKSIPAAPGSRDASRRSPCPVACALDLLGDKWTLLVVRDLLLGRAQFKEFAASPEGIATNILSERLNRLLAAGLVERFALPDHPGREGYRLTAAGQALGPIVEALAAWGLAHLDGTRAALRPKTSARD